VVAAGVEVVAAGADGVDAPAELATGAASDGLNVSDISNWTGNEQVPLP
jgi:hypothetical protein